MHANARLTPRGRLLLCERIVGGVPVAHVAEQMGVSRSTAYRWWRRFQAEGPPGLVDRSSRPVRSPRRTDPQREAQVVELRRGRRWGPLRIGLELGMPASTVWRVLCRYRMNRLVALDRTSGRPVRRYEMARPGQLIHIDIKKLGKIPDGGGWAKLGPHKGKANSDRYRFADGTPRRYRRVGYTYLHVAIDDHSRVAYVEALPNEQAVTAIGFLHRAIGWFASQGVTVEAVMTDNGAAYISHLWADTLETVGIRHIRTRPYRPQTNGKAERFNRTLKEEWAYAQTYTSEHQRTESLDKWIHQYNHDRNHTAIGGPPIHRVTNLPG